MTLGAPASVLEEEEAASRSARRPILWGRGLRRGIGALFLTAILGAVLLFALGRADVAMMRWPVKTLRDRDRGLVRFEPVDSTVAELSRAARPPDSAFRGGGRIAAEERTVYRVRAKLRGVIGGADGDMHLVLADPADRTRTILAEIPNPLLALGSGYEPVFRAERALLARHRRRKGEIVEVTGVGFFDYYISGRTNGFELHPVIGLRFVTAR